jgi:hypothetical protein
LNLKENHEIQLILNLYSEKLKNLTKQLIKEEEEEEEDNEAIQLGYHLQQYL